MIKKLNFLFLLLIFHFVCYGMDISELKKPAQQNPMQEQLNNLIQKYNFLSPAQKLLKHVENNNELKIKLSFSLLEKIKALMKPDYEIPKEKILNSSLYSISKNKEKAEIDNKILKILTLSKNDLKSIEGERGGEEKKKEKILEKEVNIDLTKNTTLDILKRAVVVTRGGAIGFGLAWALVKDLEFQPATFIDDPKIIPLGFKGLLIKLAGLCGGALMATIVEWENLKNSISEKIKNFLLEKNNINQKIKEWSEGDNVQRKRLKSM